MSEIIDDEAAKAGQEWVKAHPLVRLLARHFFRIASILVVAALTWGTNVLSSNRDEVIKLHENMVILTVAVQQLSASAGIAFTQSAVTASKFIDMDRRVTIIESRLSYHPNLQLPQPPFMPDQR